MIAKGLGQAEMGMEQGSSLKTEQEAQEEE